MGALNDLAAQVYENSRSKGFWRVPYSAPWSPLSVSPSASRPPKPAVDGDRWAVILLWIGAVLILAVCVGFVAHLT